MLQDIQTRDQIGRRQALRVERFKIDNMLRDVWVRDLGWLSLVLIEQEDLPERKITNQEPRQSASAAANVKIAGKGA